MADDDAKVDGFYLSSLSFSPDDDFGLTDEVLEKLVTDAIPVEFPEHGDYAALRTGILKVVREHINAAGPVNADPIRKFIEAQRDLPADMAASIHKAIADGSLPYADTLPAAPSDGWTSDPPDAGSLPVARKGGA